MPIVLNKFHYGTSTPTPKPAWEIIFEDGFEGDFPGSWKLLDNTGGSYQFGKSDCRSAAGNFSAWAVGTGTANCTTLYPEKTTTWMIFGPFDLSNALAADLKFKAYYNTEPNWDYVRWLASSNGTTYNGWQISGNSGGWVEHMLDLADVPNSGSMLGDDSVWIAFQFASDTDVNFLDGFFVDEVKLRKCTANCP